MKTTDPTPLSGRQFSLSYGGYTAEIAGVGASLRSLRFDGRNLILPYDAEEIRPFFRGAVLAPWPNRVVDGQYQFDGVSYALSITEPERSHALHGLLAWQEWEPVTVTDSSARLQATVVAQKGYPFRLSVEVTYTLDHDGLHTAVTAVNTGTGAAPYGTAAHPYLVAGNGRVDEWTLQVPARKVLDVTPDRLIPTALTEVYPELDFRSPREIGTTFVDHAYTELDYDDGAVTVRVTGPGGHGAAITFGHDCPWVQIHTGDQPDPSVSRLGLAVEPMTCPPDAFNSGTDLVVLQPGASHSAQWRIHAG